MNLSIDALNIILEYEWMVKFNLICMKLCMKRSRFIHREIFA